MTVEFRPDKLVSPDGQAFITQDTYFPVVGLIGVQLKEDRKAMLYFDNPFNYYQFVLSVQKFSSFFKVQKYERSIHQNCRFSSCRKQKHAILVPTDSYVLPINIFDWLMGRNGGNSKDPKAGYGYQKLSLFNSMVYEIEPEEEELIKAAIKEKDSLSETAAQSSIEDLPSTSNTALDESSSMSINRVSSFGDLSLREEDSDQMPNQITKERIPPKPDMRFEKPPLTPRHKTDELKHDEDFSTSVKLDKNLPYLGSTYKKWLFDEAPPAVSSISQLTISDDSPKDDSLACSPASDSEISPVSTASETGSPTEEFDILKIGQKREKISAIRAEHEKKWNRIGSVHSKK